MKCAQAALTLAIHRVRRSKWHPRIIGSVDPGNFVNLNLSSSSGEHLANLRSARVAEKLVEIRVSRDAIIEVFANCGSDESIRNAYAVSEPEYPSAWEESYAHLDNLQGATSDFRRARRLKYFMGYGAFVAAVALAVWCAVR